MLSQYIKVALRNFGKYKGVTVINVLGLTVGFASFLLLLQYVSFEWSFDKFHEDYDRIYRVINERSKDGERVQLGAITYPVVGKQLKEDYPEVEEVTRILPGFSYTVENAEGGVFLVDRLLFVDSSFFSLFSFPILAGDRENLVVETNTLVLTESAARRFFAVEELDISALVGKTVRLGNYVEPFTVTGICADLPTNSSLQSDIFVSYPSALRYFGEGVDNSWQWSDFYHYVKLASDVDLVAFEEKLEGFGERHFRDGEVSGAEEAFYLQPLAEAHLSSADLEYEIGRIRNGKTVNTMLIVALLILLLAWVNYINLTTVRAVERSKEVGVRKVVGARQQELIGQFLIEAALVNIVSLGLAWQLAQVGRRYLAGLLEAELSLAYSSFGLLTGAVLLFLLGILLSGAYPAWLLAGFKTSEVLKGNFQSSSSGRWLRQGLIVLQFTASIVLMSGTLLVYRQINFMNKQDLGFAIDQIVALEGPTRTRWDSTFIDRANSFKDAVTSIPGVESVTFSSRVPGSGMGRIFDIRLEGAGNDRSYSANFIETDYEYTDTYGLATLAGRPFKFTDHHYDGRQVNTVLLNQSAAKHFGFHDPEQAINREITFFEKTWKIVGVVTDHHQRSLQYAIEPIVYLPYYGTHQSISVKVDRADPQVLMDRLGAVYGAYFPGNAFDYTFLDNFFQRQYEAERLFAKLLLLFTLLAFFIACLGLFGLASYAVLVRRKEIGIRKVLGASVEQIVAMLSKDFLRLVVIAVLIAVPLTWFMLKRWLENFAYKASFGWWVFGVVAVVTLLIAFLTVGFHSAKAAVADPVRALDRDQ